MATRVAPQANATPAQTNTPADPTRQAMDYFIAQGWTQAQAAGIVADLQAESNLRPTAVGDNGRAAGIAQWHPDRQADFQAQMNRSVQGSTPAPTHCTGSSHRRQA